MINYERIPTEKAHPASRALDRLPVEAAIDLMNRENASIPAAISAQKKSIARAVQWIAEAYRLGRSVFFFGAGTSGRLGVLEAAELPPTFSVRPARFQAIMAGGKPAVFRSKEGAEDQEGEGGRIARQKIGKGDVAVGIAASGVTPFVRGALMQARRRGARTILITCNPKARWPFKPDGVIALSVGPEIVSGSTRLKSGTATKMVLNMLTTLALVQCGKVYGNLMVDLQPKSRKLVERSIRLVQQLANASRAEALWALKKSGGNAKTAIVMLRAGLDLRSAAALLRRENGFLRRALESAGSLSLKK